MPTLPRQDRLRSSGDELDELLPAGALLEDQPNLLGDLNAIRSQLRRLVLHVSGGAHWYDDPVGTGSAGGAQTLSNKRMPARDTTADQQLACGIAVLNTPIAGSYVGVRLNGVDVVDVGDGSKVGVSCYFSGDGGATPRAWADITLGDTLWWNGSVAGYELSATTDVIEFVYET